MSFSTRWSGEGRASLTHRGALLLILALGAAVSLAVYLAASWRWGHVGFPLDDAWIHQTYARNLVQCGQWAFLPGSVSAGSTAPLWTLLLAVGYALGLPFRAWTYGLGWLCLVGTALLAVRLAERLGLGPPARSARAPWPSVPGPWALGLAVVLEWHLVWAAVSGMETLLFALLALALWVRMAGMPTGTIRACFLTGLLGGALVLTRPEGALAAGLAAGGALLAEGLERHWRRGLAAGLMLVAGAALVVAPYLALNFHLSGTPWPNTLYAKQAEYAVYLAQPLAVRLWHVGSAPLVGAQILLVPGLVRVLWLAWRRDGRSPRQQVGGWLPLAWLAATVGVYALRLPVTYQHGRYLMPVIPVLLVYSLAGTLDLFHRLQGEYRRPAVTRRSRAVAVWALSTAVLLLAFLFLGARAYATDVAIIEEEMVAIARWVNMHTPSDALVAVHDIGAVGYFARRRLLDLAGLVNPEVVPFIRDEERLLAWLQERGADYLVTFPSWYPVLTADPQLKEVYRTQAGITLAQGGENMAVYVLSISVAK